MIQGFQRLEDSQNRGSYSLCTYKIKTIDQVIPTEVTPTLPFLHHKLIQTNGQRAPPHGQTG